MNIEDVRTYEAMLAFDRVKSWELIAEKLPHGDAERLLFSPILLQLAAFDYMDAACRVASDLKLNFKKEVRLLRKLMDKLYATFKIPLGVELYNELVDVKDSFFDKGDSSFNNIWKIIRNRQMRDWPELSVDLRTFYSNLSMAYLLLVAAQRSESECVENFNRCTSYHLTLTYDAEYFVTLRLVKCIAGAYLVNPTPMIIRSLNALMKRCVEARNSVLTIDLKKL